MRHEGTTQVGDARSGMTYDGFHVAKQDCLVVNWGDGSDYLDAIR